MECESDLFGGAILAYLDHVQDSPEHVEGIMAALAYLDKFPRQDATKIVQNLRSYPYRSEVRRRAEALQSKLIY